MMRFAKKLFLFCMLTISCYNNAPAACEPSDKPYEYEFCAHEPYQQDPLEFVTRIQVRHVPNESTTFEEKPQPYGEVRFQSVPPASQSAPSRGLGNAEVHAMNPVRRHNLNHHHYEQEPRPIVPTGYNRMQLNGDKVSLTAALRDLEKKIEQRWWPCFGTRRQIAEIKAILNSPVTHYLNAIRTDDLGLAKAKIQRLGFDISRGLYGRNPWVYNITYQAATNIYVERCEQALIQEENAKKQAALAHEKKIALESAAAQKLAVQKEIELAKQQLLVQAKKIVHPLERENAYEQITDLEACYHDLFISDFSYAQVSPEVDQKIACEVAHEGFIEDDEQGTTDRQALEQEKQALLKQAKRTIHPLERAELCRQADLIEARIQALAQEATVFNDSPPMVIDGRIILDDSAFAANQYAYQFDAIMTHACQANLAGNADVDEKVAQEVFGLNDNAPMVIPADFGFGHPNISFGDRAFEVRNYDYAYDSVLTHAYLDNCTIDPEFNNKIVRAVCEGLQEVGYAFATKALNPYEALETYKELGESMASLAKGAFYLTVGRDIYILSGGKYCMSDAELRENIYLVIKAIKEIDPSAFSAKQVGEFAGTEAAKMVHTFGLGKIISVVSKVNMASKARSLVKKLDKVTRAAQAERAVAVTAEGFVVEAAHEARAGSLALSEINNASQAEKRVAQAAAGLAQEGANGIRPLDYGHSAIQYEQLKKALRIEEFTSIVKVTKHGLERLMERFTPEAVKATLLTPDFVKIQENGVKAFIKQAGNNYNFIALNEKTGAVVTALNNRAYA